MPGSGATASAPQAPEHDERQRARRDDPRARLAPRNVGRVVRARPARWHRELLGGEHVVGLGDAGRIVGQLDGPVVKDRVGRRHPEFLRGQHVVGALLFRASGLWHRRG